MSYLSIPRLNFAGTFTTRVPTINNLPANFQRKNYPAIAAEMAVFRERPRDDYPLLGFDPLGSGELRITEATVLSYVGLDGKVHDHDNCPDPVIGARVETVNGPSGVPGKLVDLDPETGAARIFGMFLGLSLKGSDTPELVGEIQDTGTLDLWVSRSGDNFFADSGGSWQSVLRDCRWGAGIERSVWLQQLREASGGHLSVRITLFDFNPFLGTETYTQGHVVGTVGPSFPEEPKHFIAGRFLVPQAGAAMYFSWGQLDEARRTLTLELSNSIPGTPTTQPRAPRDYSPVDLGVMEAVSLPAAAEPISLGQIDYSRRRYDLTAGVAQLDLGHLSDARWQQLHETPIGIRTTLPGQPPVLQLTEKSDGIYVEVDRGACYLSSNETVVLEVYARRFGRPLPDYTLDLELRPREIDPAPILPGQYPLPAGTNAPPDGLSFPLSVTTGGQGNTSISVVAGAIDQEAVAKSRRALRSQLYYLWGSWAAENNFFAPFVAKVFFSSQAIPYPTWADVRPLLTQYFFLYPAMSDFFLLNDYESVKAHADGIRKTILLPTSDALYMPVTRDMSREETALLLRWIHAGCPYE